MVENKHFFKGFSLIAVVSGILGVGAIVSLIYLSAFRQLTPLETALFTVLIVVFQAGFSVYTGWWTARESARREYEPFVRSALRRTYGLSEGLGRVQSSVVEGLRRMSARKNVDPSLLSPLWAEIMNLVHSQLNEQIQQAEASIEDWREIGREEIQKIEQVQRKKQEEIAELTRRLNELYQLMGDLAQSPSGAEPTIDRLEDLAAALERELESLRSRSVLSPTERILSQTASPKELLIRGAFADAVQAYTRMIEMSPTGHTLYVGRARARYLSGDRDGAIADLDMAAELKPNDPSVQSAKDLLLKQHWFPPVSTGMPSNLITASMGNQALSQGRLDDARRLFGEAREQGLNPAFAAVNFAMLEFAEGRIPEARAALAGFNDKVAGPFMRVQIEALRTFFDCAEQKQLDTKTLDDALARCPVFELTKSPLLHLQGGLAALGKVDANVEFVFSRLKHIKAVAGTINDSSGAAPASPGNAP